MSLRLRSGRSSLAKDMKTHHFHCRGAARVFINSRRRPICHFLEVRQRHNSTRKVSMHSRNQGSEHSLMPMPGAPRSLHFAKQQRPSSQYGPTLVDIGQPNTHFSRQAYTGDSTSPHTSSRRLLNTEHRVDRRAALVRVCVSVLQAPSPAVQLAHRSMIAI